MDKHPSRKPIRLPKYDYATPSAYFVTVCTRPRRNLFWNHQPVGADSIRPPSIKLSPIGQTVACAIAQIPLRYPHISVDNYAVMPDHIHLLITIHADERRRQIAAPTLSTVVGQFKRSVSKQLGFSVWQKSFLERVIRNDNDYETAWQYIDNNPLKQLYPE